jgi:hypothetical protein
LKKILSDLTGCDVHIYATTEMGNESIAKLDLTGTKAEVVINLARVKGLNEAINALSHEGAHLITRDSAHGTDFKDQRDKLRKDIVFQYTHNKKYTE